MFYTELFYTSVEYRKVYSFSLSNLMFFHKSENFFCLLLCTNVKSSCINPLYY